MFNILLIPLVNLSFQVSYFSSLEVLFVVLFVVLSFSSHYPHVLLQILEHIYISGFDILSALFIIPIISGSISIECFFPLVTGHIFLLLGMPSSFLLDAIYYNFKFQGTRNLVTKHEALLCQAEYHVLKS